MDFGEDASVVDEETGLPNREGWCAVLAAEEERARRHGGVHGLVLVRFDDAAIDLGPVARAAHTIAGSLRDIDVLARVDHRTFAVLALHCDDLGRVVDRIRDRLEAARFTGAALVEARAAGSHLQATWSALATGGGTGTPAVAYIGFVATARMSLN